MRANEFLNEIEPITQKSYQMGNTKGVPYISGDDDEKIDYKDKKTQQILSNAQPFLPKFNISIIKTPQSSGGLRSAYISTKNKKIVGYIEFDMDKKFGFLQIKHIKVLDVARGNNLGIEGYKYLMRKYKKPVASDYIQTPASKNLWVRLASDPEVEVVGSAVVPNTPKYNSMMKKMNGTKVGGIKNYWNHYTFPLTKSSKMLKPSTSGKLKLYDKNAPEEVDVGLLAYLK